MTQNNSVFSLRLLRHLVVNVYYYKGKKKNVKVNLHAQQNTEVMQNTE